MSAAANIARRVTSPYVGPNPLKFGDPIFGRDSEIEDLLDQLTADRIVLLYSPSGCGKTSLIEAGLRHDLPSRRFFALPTIRAGKRPAEEQPDVTEPHSRNALLQAAFSDLEAPRVENGKTLVWPARKPNTRLTEFLDKRIREPEEMARDDGKIYEMLIFDQFEEVLTSVCTEEERIAFFKEVAVALAKRDRWALFSIREDYVGALEPYVKLLPSQLSSRFPLPPLSVENGQFAIRELARKGGVDFKEDAAKLLADFLAGGGWKQTDESVDGSGALKWIEPVQLQVVCDYLWRQKPQGFDTITVNDLHLEENNNTVEEALAQYYGTRVQEVAGADEDLERQIRDWFDEKLITKEGFRRPVQLNYAAAKFGEQIIDDLIDRYLIRKDVRLGVAWLEVSHDRLVPAIRDDNTCWRRAHLQGWQELARKWNDSGRQSAFLIVGDKQTLEKARDWERAKRDRGERLNDVDEDFLNASEIEDRRMRRYEELLRTNRRRAKLFGAVALGSSLLALGTWFLAVKTSQVEVARANETAAALNMKAAATSEKAAAVNQMAISMARRAAADKKIAEDKLRQSNEQVYRNENLLHTLENQRASLVTQIAQSNQRINGLNKEKNQAEEDLTSARSTLSDVRKEKDEALGLERQALSNKNSLENLMNSKDSPPQQALDFALAAVEDLQLDQSPQEVKSTLIGVSDALGRSLRVREFPFSGDDNIVSLASMLGGSCVVTITNLGAISKYPVEGENPDCTKLSYPNKAEGWVTAADFSSVQNDAALGLSTGKVAVLRSGSNEPVSVTPHYHEIVSLALSPDAHYLAAASSVWNFSVWNLNRRKGDTIDPKRLYQAPGAVGWIKRLFGGSTNLVNSISLFDPPGREGYVAAAYEDGSISVHGVNSSRELMRIPGPYEGKVQKDERGHAAAALSIAFSPDGKSLISGGSDRAARVWNLDQDERNWKTPSVMVAGQVVLTGCSGAVTPIAISPNNELIATGCADGNIRLYQLREVRDLGGATAPPAAEMPRHVDPIETLHGHRGSILLLRFDPKQRVLVSSSNDRKLAIWRIPKDSDLKKRQMARHQIEDWVATNERIIGGEKTLTPGEREDLVQTVLDAVKRGDAQIREAAVVGSVKDKW